MRVRKRGVGPSGQEHRHDPIVPVRTGIRTPVIRLHVQTPAIRARAKAHPFTLAASSTHPSVSYTHLTLPTICSV
eukprot:4422674-Prymnesium_polylepis.2